MKIKNIEDVYPLSPLQSGILFETLVAPHSGVYTEQFCYTLTGNLDTNALRQAWQHLINRHPVLRTAFFWDGLEKPLQVVRQQVALPWQDAPADWRGLSEAEQAARLSAFLSREREEGFALDQAPLMHVTLIQLAEARYYLVWTHHHILIDGWCMPLLIKELITCYETALTPSPHSSVAPAAPRPYRDYIHWLQRQERAQAEKFWRRELEGFSTPTSLPNPAGHAVKVEPPPANRRGGEGARKRAAGSLTHSLSPASSVALQALARRHHLTLNTLFQGAWALLLSRYSGQTDLLFGATVAGRPPELAGVEKMIGLFINTLPVRVRMEGQEALLPWLQRLQEQQRERESYAYSALVDIQGWSDMPRGTQMFESLLVFENYPLDETIQSGQGIAMLEVKTAAIFEKTNYPLTVIAAPGTEFSLRLYYDTSRFDAATISRMVTHLAQLLESMVAQADAPRSPLASLSMLSQAERHQLLVEWNNSQTDYPRHQYVHHLFEEQAQKTPHAIAVVGTTPKESEGAIGHDMGEQKSLTYHQLNERANQVAHHLHALGVLPETYVGLCVERSLDLVVGLLGILKAGGAYVPFDPAYPSERLAFMLADTQVPIMLTQERLLDTLPSDYQGHLVCLDSDWQTISQAASENPATSLLPHHPLYLLYTSGSTGKPKGVILEHQALANLIQWQIRHTHTKTPTPRTLQFAPFSFDVSFQEIFSTLSLGATLYLISEEIRRDAQALLAYLSQHQIERIFLPFVALQQLADIAQTMPVPTSLQQIIAAGEPLQITSAIASLFERLPNCTLSNHYGPTESHVVTAYDLTAPVSEWPTLPPIGCPIANSQLYLLDQQLQPVPIGVAGELYIGGAQVARGYHNRPELSKEKFILALSRQRLYRTGDLARYLPDGSLEFLGRIDHQVKIRGFRVELGEIEATLTQHPEVQEAAVVVHEAQPRHKQLVAYVVLKGEDAGSQNQRSIAAVLRHFLAAKLPDYMIPAIFMPLDALPLTPSGKINRRGLPAPEQSLVSQGYVAPRTPIEKRVATIWQKVLGLKRVGITDDFFELGGHSLLATQVISRIRRTWQIDLPLRTLFAAPTVMSLAEQIETLKTMQEIANRNDEETEERERIAL